MRVAGEELTGEELIRDEASNENARQGARKARSTGGTVLFQVPIITAGAARIMWAARRSLAEAVSRKNQGAVQWGAWIDKN